jgi:hypothetical protein
MSKSKQANILITGGAALAARASFAVKPVTGAKSLP